MVREIIHITSHMGGGVGKVLSGIAAFTQMHDVGYKHKLVLLEKPQKMNFIDICIEHQVDICVYNNRQEIERAMHEADLVQIEWWHHPVMAGFLAEFPQVPIRLLVWSHISGSYYPWIPPEFLLIPEKFIFTSQYSFFNPYWDENKHIYAEKNCAMVNSSGGFSCFPVENVAHHGFNVGYIGTQSYVKLHPDYLKYCKIVSNLPGIRFTMVGDQCNQKKIISQAKRIGIADYFTFIDYVADVNMELGKMDVFAYLLNSTHFGTTENVLLEAMAAELPVVCMDQCAERYLIKNGETGFLIKNEEEYHSIITWLYEHPEERERIGKNARKYVLKNFSVENTVFKLHKVYDSVMMAKRKTYNFCEVFGTKPYEYFLTCLIPELRIVFEKALKGIKCESFGDILPLILKENSKSSLPHFYKKYPEEKAFKIWNSLIDNNKKSEF